MRKNVYQLFFETPIYVGISDIKRYLSTLAKI